MDDNLAFLHDAMIAGRTPGFWNTEFNIFRKNRNKHQHVPEKKIKPGLWLRKQFATYIVSPVVLFVSVMILMLLPDDFLARRITNSVFKSIQHTVKRVLDILLSLIGLVLSFSFFLVIPILIKLGSKGGVFYKQIRIGKNRRQQDSWEKQIIYHTGRASHEKRKVNYHGKPFYVYKFRTMRADAELMTGPVWASRNDPRVTSVGNFLRKTHLDEIPQFINVIKGDMSLVGPRPERPCFVVEFAEIIPKYTDRFKIKPGITGKAQIFCGYDTSIEDVKQKLEHDIEYVQHGKLTDDFKFMFMSIWTMIARKGDS
ncbi:sugar transferase [candidate division KSB1 bacterium]|nr:sugar transferase [candidate division KSB1 bacterium]